ncbi:MAG: Na+/H+ antiporter NhaC family protein, partial [Rhodothermales bacterium]
MRYLIPLLLIAFLGGPASAQPFEIEAPSVILEGRPFSVTVRGAGADSTLVLRVGDGPAIPLIRGEGDTFLAEGIRADDDVSLKVEMNGQVVAEAEANVIPGWFSILPPLLAIAIALLFRQVIPALFLGIWVGAWAALGLGPTGLWGGLLDSFQVYVLTALANPDHAAIVLFSL